jgi:hypothetical protein
MQVNLTESSKSRCTFCGSPNYGKGCKFGPHGIHLHTDDTTKCSYCGSKNYGKGCKINPVDDIHIRGAIYNNMYKENVRRFLDYTVFLTELSKEFKQFNCYKLGVIDEHGNKIKTPVTEQEINSYCPFTKLLIKLKKYLGPKVDLIVAEKQLKYNSLSLTEGYEKHKKVLEYQEKTNKLINELYKLISDAQSDGLSFSEVRHLFDG